MSAPQPIPARISDDGRTATWNPGMTYAAQVLVRVRVADATFEERRSMNSGRARVREGEAIEAILAESLL
jgi:predicted transcriptional regulator